MCEIIHMCEIMHMCQIMHMCEIIHICDRIIHKCKIKHTSQCYTGWRRLTGCLKSQVIFHKRAVNYRALLRKMTCEDKASYESSLSCSVRALGTCHHTSINVCKHIMYTRDRFHSKCNILHIYQIEKQKCSSTNSN